MINPSNLFQTATLTSILAATFAFGIFTVPTLISNIMQTLSVA